MPALQQTSLPPSIFRRGGALVMMCVLIIGRGDLSGQAVDTNTVANPAPQTNAVTTEVTPVYPELEATNLVSPATNAFEYVEPVAPEPYAAAPGPTIGTGQLAAPMTGTSALTGVPPGVPQPAGAAGIWQAGGMVVHAQLTETLIYGTGLQYSPGTPVSTFVDEVTPGVTLNAGAHWVFNYAPTIVTYSSDKFQDTVNQTESLTGATSYEDWIFGLRQGYAKSTSPLVETAEETTTEMFNTSLSATRKLNSDFSVQMSVGQNYQDAVGFDIVEAWSAATSLSYSPVKQVSFDLSLSGGYDQINVGSDMIDETLQAGLSFRPGTKLKLSLTGGAQEIEFVHPSAAGYITPVFSASAAYQATESTLLSVNAGESVSPSFYGNEFITSTGVAATLRQQLLGKLSLSVSGSYSTSPYTSIEPEALPQHFLGAAPQSDLETVRNDTTETISVSLSYLFGQRIATSVFYTGTENSSGQVNYKYSSSQEGFSLTYRY